MAHKAFRLPTLFVFLTALTACGPDRGAIDPAQTTLGSPPVASPSSPFGHNMHAGVQTGPGLLLASWNHDASVDSWSGEARNANRRAEASAFTAAIGQPVAWTDPASASAGSVTATRDYYTASGDYCRTFTETVNSGGVQRTGQPSACQQADGSWKIVK